MDTASRLRAVSFPSYEAYIEAAPDNALIMGEKEWIKAKFEKAANGHKSPDICDAMKMTFMKPGERALHLAEKMLASGMKHDDGKKKWHALPLTLLEPLADVMQAGVKKYAKFNCLEKFDNPDERFYNGMMRHIEACQVDPLAIDKETGCYHAAQIAFNTLMRLYHCKKDAEESDLSDL